MSRKAKALKTDIFNGGTPEFFINMKNIPPKGSPERGAFVSEEKRKAREGININGVYIPGGLYFHLNYYYLQGDDPVTGRKTVMLPNLRDNEWIAFNDYAKAEKEKKIYNLFGARQIGKDLLNSSLLYKEDCEITIGEVKVGDRIYDESGNLTSVTGVYPQGKRPVYKMTLLDGRVLYCGLDHNWYVWNHRKSNGYKEGKKKNGKNPLGGYEIKTTRELLVDYRKVRDSWTNKRKNNFEYKYAIPNGKAVQYPEKNLLIDPYLLGLYLGDGSNYYSKITTVDKEIENYLYKISESMELQITKDGEETFMITAGKEGNRRSQKNIFHKFLIESNLYQNKHIPKEYLYASEEQRMELLRGLTDSDGYVDKNGAISFSSSIPKLAEDFVRLCQSLGISVSKKKRKSGYKKNGQYVECKDSYRIDLYTDKDVFKLSRKLERCKAKKKYIDKMSIVDIQYVFDDETTCITVDNKSHLFLTDGYTVTHNSEIETSLTLRELSLYRDTEALAIFSGLPDKQTFVKKIRTAIQYGEKFMIIPNIDKDWKKEEIRFGVTKSDNTLDLRGVLYIYNTDGGTNIQIGAGKSVSFLLFDEIAKKPFQAVFDVIEPALLSDTGKYRCAPLLAFTGGEIEEAQDAKNFVTSPIEEKHFTSTMDDGTVVAGKFFSGLYRKDCKEETTVQAYTGITTNTWLDNYPIKVSNLEKANQKIEKELEIARKSPDKGSYNLKRIFFPRTLDDVFLTEANNNFPIQQIVQQQEWLKENYEPTYIDLFRDLEGKVEWKFSTLKPINKFPVRPHDDKTAPICIYEMPVKGAPKRTYSIGIDPITHNDSNDKIVSLASIYVFKRMLSPLDDYKDAIVASWTGRPDKLEDFHELSLMLAEFYEAEEGVLPEAPEQSLIQYFILKKKAKYLAPSFDLTRSIFKLSKINDKFGLKPTIPNQRHYMNLEVQYAKGEEFEVQEEGEEVYVSGVSKVKDPMLLEEWKEYKMHTTGKGVHAINVDRVVAFGCAITLANHWDITFGSLSTLGVRKPRPQEYKSNIVKTPFGTISNNPSRTYSGRGRIFGI